MNFYGCHPEQSAKGAESKDLLFPRASRHLRRKATAFFRFGLKTAVMGHIVFNIIASKRLLKNPCFVSGHGFQPCRKGIE
jgi:hypothetical protein